MATRRDYDVTLPHEMAERVERLLSDYADSQRTQANRTKSAAVRSYCDAKADECRHVSQYIVARLWSWENEPAETVTA